MPPLGWWLVTASAAALAFVLRVAPHPRRRALGQDTWYFLAYADALRKRPGLDVRLPQYLLQDERQTYPPLFPSLLALLPGAWLRRRFWAVSPLLECVHLLLLAWVAWRATRSSGVSALVALAFAFNPQAVLQPRALNPKSLALLLYSSATLAAVEHAAGAGWLPAAALGGALFLTSAALSGAYVVVSGGLAVLCAEPRHLWVACASLTLAVLCSGGHLFRVAGNYLHALRFWRRHHARLGADPVRESPLHGGRQAPGGLASFPKGLLGQGPLAQLLRLVADNPYLLLLAVSAPSGATVIRAWAFLLGGTAVLVTVTPRFRFFGLGRSLAGAAVFPALYGLADAMREGVGTPVGLGVVACLLASLAACLLLFGRRPPEQGDPAVDEALFRASRALADLPAGGVMCLPYELSGYVGYVSGRPILWGGHCGDLSRFEALVPVIARPLGELFEHYDVRYVVVDTRRADAADVGLAPTMQLRGQWGPIALWGPPLQRT